jgi:hypothetical protein
MVPTIHAWPARDEDNAAPEKRTARLGPSTGGQTMASLATGGAAAPRSSDSRLDWAILLAPATLKLALQLAFIRGYGLHGDELYYIACSEHLDWGYVDHPPLCALVLRGSRLLLGDSAFGIRFLAAVAGAAIVLLTQLLARRFGAGRYGELLAALCALVAPLYLALSHIFSMNVFDVALWLGAAYVVVCLLDGGRRWLWLVLGLIFGIGLENKLSLLFLGFGLAVGLLLAGPRGLLRSRWPWLGACVAMALFLPHVLWQAAHGWPTLEFMENARVLKNLRYSLPSFVGEQLVLLHPATFPVWAAGLAWLVVRPAGRRWRALGWAYVAVLLLLVFQGGKPYYLGPAYGWLFAAGAVAIESVLVRRWARAASLVVLAAAGVVTAPLAVPIVPVERYPAYQRALGLRPSSGERFAEGELPAFFANMFGWDRLASLVDEVYRSLPPEERARCRVLCENYMQAGAIDFYGRPLGLPRAVSGHNSYYLWNPEPPAVDVFIVIGRSEKDLRAVFEDVEWHATFRDPHIQPIHDDKPIWVVRHPRVPLGPVWPRIKSFI